MADFCSAVDTNSSGAWDFVLVGSKFDKDAVTICTLALNEAGETDIPGVSGGQAYAHLLRPSTVARPINVGEFLDLTCERGGSRNLALLKQFVKVKIAFADDADGKACRKWLRGDEA